MNSHIIIPARLRSTRLPQKLLLAETGKPLIQHTYESAQAASHPSGICVAADDERIAEAVRSSLRWMPVRQPLPGLHKG